MWLLLASIAGFGGLLLAIAAGEKVGDASTDNWWLAGPALVAAGSGIGAFGTRCSRWCVKESERRR